MKNGMIVVLVLILAAPVAFADRAIQGFYFDQNVGASWDPLGAQAVTQLFYRIPLSQSDNILWSSAKVDFGVVNNFSPSYDLAGVFVSIQPIAVFNLVLEAQAAGYFHQLGFGFYTLSGYDAGFDNASLAQLTPIDTTGYVLSAAPTLQVAFGPVALRDTFSLTYYNANGGTGFFYERIGNVALAGSDVELLNQAYALATVYPGLLVGLNDYYLVVTASSYVSHRLAAMAVYTNQLSPKVSLYSILLLGTFLADRYFQYTIYVGGEVGVTVQL